jgi:cytochrome c-type biogenesis protein CcmH/NrfG
VGQGLRVTEQYPAYWLAYIWLGSAYREKKMYSQALEQFAKGRQLSGDQPVLISLHGHALAVSGVAAGARKALADLQHLSQNVVSSAPAPARKPPHNSQGRAGK